MKFIEVSLLFLAVLGIVKATEWVVGGLRVIARETKVDKFGLTAFLLALTTSLPELVVGLAAALEGDSSIALGNVLGSNIADLSLVIGGAALVGGSIRVKGKFMKRDLWLSFLAGCLPLLMLVDGRLTRVDGVVLLLVYGIYVTTILKEENKLLEKEEHNWQKRLFSIWHKPKLKANLFKLLLGIGGLVGGSYVVVELAERVAVGLGLPLLLIGLILVALGTSLPELMFEFKAVRAGETGMVFGDLLGSIVANSTLILGLVALINPVQVDGGLVAYGVGTVSFVVLFGLFWGFAMTKQKLEWWEGTILLLGYIVFVINELVF